MNHIMQGSGPVVSLWEIALVCGLGGALGAMAGIVIIYLLSRRA
jgi:hypothetical protein